MGRTSAKTLNIIEVTFTQEEANQLLIDAAKADVAKGGGTKLDSNGPVWVRPDNYRGYIVSLKKVDE